MRLPRLLDLRRPHTQIVWALALVFTLLNAVKPLVIDDTAYYYFARQITRDPLRPYDFSMLWYQWPHPANDILAPPVLPYWWAIALALFGENTFLWKLWLFPFSLLFVGALDRLLRRFARGVATPVWLMTVLSPTFLPSLNLMLDVPALALSLSAIAVFFRAYARRSIGRSLFAGLLAGLAMETKYTAFLAPAVILLYAAIFWGRPFAVQLRRRVLLAVLAVLTAASFFFCWECLIAHFHGESHFLCNLRQNDMTLADKLDLALPLLLILGALSSPIVLLSLTALGLPRSAVGVVGGILATDFVLIAVVPQPSAPEHLLADLLFGVIGVLTLVTAAAVIGRLLLDREPEEKGSDADGIVLLPVRSLDRVRWATDWFLILWLGGEIMGYFALTPFPAARRLMGIVTVGTLLAARLASRTCRSRARQALLHGVAAAGVAWGLVFYGVDLHGAFAEKVAAERAAETISAFGREGTAWYVGHWGFQHYAERAGLKPVIPDQSHLREGDWLVVPDGKVNGQKILVDNKGAELVWYFDVTDALPLRTLPGFYGGSTPLEPNHGPHVSVRIYRVTRAFVPATDWDKIR